jgi:hypothetical protein
MSGKGEESFHLTALDVDKAMFTPDGKMPLDGPETELRVPSSVEKRLQGNQIDSIAPLHDDFGK